MLTEEQIEILRRLPVGARITLRYPSGELQAAFVVPAEDGGDVAFCVSAAADRAEGVLLDIPYWNGYKELARDDVRMTD